MYIKEIIFESSRREEIIDITNKVKEVINNSGIKDGICLIYVPHATAGVIINENYDENVSKDILNYLRKTIPKGIWLHDKIDNNADSHIKSSILGVSQVIPISNKNLMLGTWQGIGLVELDGPRKRKVIICIIEDKNE